MVPLVKWLDRTVFDRVIRGDELIRRYSDRAASGGWTRSVAKWVCIVAIWVLRSVLVVWSWFARPVCVLWDAARCATAQGMEAPPGGPPWITCSSSAGGPLIRSHAGLQRPPWKGRDHGRGAIDQWAHRRRETNPGASPPFQAIPAQFPADYNLFGQNIGCGPSLRMNSGTPCDS